MDGWVALWRPRRNSCQCFVVVFVGIRTRYGEDVGTARIKMSPKAYRCLRPNVHLPPTTVNKNGRALPMQEVV